MSVLSLKLQALRKLARRRLVRHGLLVLCAGLAVQGWAIATEPLLSNVDSGVVPTPALPATPALRPLSSRELSGGTTLTAVPAESPAATETTTPPVSPIRPAPKIRLAQVQPLPAPQRVEVTRPEPVPTSPQQNPAPMFGPGLQRLPLLGDTAGDSSIPAASAQTKTKYAQFVDPDLVQPEDTLQLIEGRTYILKFKQPPKRYQVDDTIVQSDLISPQEMSLRGVSQQQQGNTNQGAAARSTVLNLWFDDPNSPERQSVLSYLLIVRPDPDTKLRMEQRYKALEEEINRLFPNSHVKLSLVGDRLAVRGEAKDIVEAAQLLQLVAANAPNNTNVEPLNVGGLNLFVNPANVGQPTINTPGEANGLLESLAQRNPNLINLLRVSGEQQVMLKVTLAEINRTAARAIGVNFNVSGDSGLTFASIPGATGLLPVAGAGALPGGIRINPVQNAARGGNLLVNQGDFQLAVNALSQLGMARTLAEPNLVALNGQTASFQAGTDIAVQNLAGGQGVVLNGFSQVFAGITLNFTPLITDRDRVRLRMVAQVGAQSGTNAAGPNITQRTVQTTVELRDGQTLAVAGLLAANYNNSSNGFPFFGDIPVVGRLFRQDTTNKTENELMIIVTPTLVHPLECDEQHPLPGDDTFEPSDVEFFIKGRLESLRSEDYRDGARTSWDRMRAYRWCEQKFIIGPHGHSDGKY
ncbi:MAG: hypothetical protein JNM18_27380 [Planctomycetaceae bacterium]|nr:hypothetical protein [Planctomycetaceae bacterium]